MENKIKELEQKINALENQINDLQGHYIENVFKEFNSAFDHVKFEHDIH